jgi:hypothetical protein
MIYFIRRTKILFHRIEKIPFLGWFTHILSPLIVTFILAIIFDRCLSKLIKNKLFADSSTAYTSALVLSLTITFFIVLFLQDRLIEHLFSGSLREYLSKTKGQHPVTKLLGRWLMSRFLVGDFNTSFFQGVGSLNELLQKIELEKGHKLFPDLYSVLLSQASDMYPVKMLAVWYVPQIPIDDVFNGVGKIIKYGEYFQEMDKIYPHISEHNKERIFIFHDENHKATQVAHPGWKSLCLKHKNWGFKRILWCFEEDTIQAKVGKSGAKYDDFAYFELGWLNDKLVIWVNFKNQTFGLTSIKTFVKDNYLFLGALRKICEENNYIQIL